MLVRSDTVEDEERKMAKELDREIVRQLLERGDHEWYTTQRGKYDCNVDERITFLSEPVNHICRAELDFLAEYLVRNYGERLSHQVPF